LRAAGIIRTPTPIFGINVLPRYINDWLLGAKIVEGREKEDI